MWSIGRIFSRWVMGAIVGGVLAVAVVAAEPEGNPRDTLVYKDGDRVQGKLLFRAGDVLVFKSDRFGELRVPTAEAVVISAEQSTGTASKPAVQAGAAATAKARAVDRAEAERVSLWDRFSPWLLTAKVRDYFGPWHGRFAFSTELVTDTADRTNIALETHLQRKWEHDEVQVNSHYDYSDTNGLATTDMLRGDATWRHDFLQGRFVQYRPTVEWNQANVRNGVANDYVLVHQEIGAGFALLAAPARKVRVGVSENLFDTWNQAPTASHSSHVVESTFVETEFKFPWRMTMTQRAVWYPFATGRTGWENHVELTKKLTETLSLTLQHEIRRNNPDGSAQDFERLKLLIGLDF
jgi:hypothetical protein